MSLARALQGFGFSVWIDGERLSGNILGQITLGVDESAVFVACVTPTYMEKVQAGAMDGADNDWCSLEFNYAFRKLKQSKMIAEVTDPKSLDPSGWVGTVDAILGGSLFVDATNPSQIAVAAEELAVRIGKMLG